MPANTRRQIHVDQALIDFSIAYKQSQDFFIADKVFMELPVENQSDAYHVWDQAAFLRSSAQPRAPGTRAARRFMTLSQDNYVAKVQSVETEITDEERANADAAVNLDQSKTDGVTHDLLIRRELDFVTNYMQTGVWATESVGGSPADVSGGSAQFAYWSDYANSDPIQNVNEWKEAIHLLTGQVANTLVVDLQTHHRIVRHPVFTELTKYTQAGNPSRQAIASAFEVDRYLVAQAVRVTSPEGATTRTSQFIINKRALLCHTPPSAGLGVPAAGTIFSWTGLLNGLGNAGIVIDRYDDDAIMAEIIRGHMAYDMKRTGAELAAFASQVIQ